VEELFHTIKACNLLAFIREIGFYHHIQFCYNLSFSISLHLVVTDG